jgi:hypothetical protein
MILKWQILDLKTKTHKSVQIGSAKYVIQAYTYLHCMKEILYCLLNIIINVTEAQNFRITFNNFQVMEIHTSGNLEQGQIVNLRKH